MAPEGPGARSRWPGVLPSHGCEVHDVLQQRRGLELAWGPTSTPGALGLGEPRGGTLGSWGGASRVAFPASQQHVEQRGQHHHGQAPEDDAQQHCVAPSWRRGKR